jgi:hypothetical protein
MPYGTGACLPAKVGSGATTCPVAPDPAFPIRRAPAPHVYHGSGVPCVLQLWILPPSREGSGAPCILQLHILPPCKGGLWSATCPTAPDPAPYREGSSVATAWPTVSYGPRGSNIKKILAGLPVQLGSHVPNARTPVSKAPDLRAVLGPQDLREGSTFNACKMCGHVATVWL